MGGIPVWLRLPAFAKGPALPESDLGTWEPACQALGWFPGEGFVGPGSTCKVSPCPSGVACHFRSSRNRFQIWYLGHSFGYTVVVSDDSLVRNGRPFLRNQ